MTLEALHHAGGLGKDFLVILNDNQMSISKNVGAISAYLEPDIHREFYTRMREETVQFLAGNPSNRTGHAEDGQARGRIGQGLILPGLLFEELGFRYVGPIDGHNFEHLLPTLENVLKMKGPVLLHVITKKGLGYEPAIQILYGFMRVRLCPGNRSSRRKKRRGQAIRRLLSKPWLNWPDKIKRIVAITAAMCEGTGLNVFEKEFPDRIMTWGLPNNMR